MIYRFWRLLTTPTPGTPPGRHLIIAAGILVLLYLCVGCSAAPIFFR